MDKHKFTKIKEIDLSDRNLGLQLAKGQDCLPEYVDFLLEDLIEKKHLTKSTLVLNIGDCELSITHKWRKWNIPYNKKGFWSINIVKKEGYIPFNSLANPSCQIRLMPQYIDFFINNNENLISEYKKTNNSYHLTWRVHHCDIVKTLEYKYFKQKTINLLK